MSDKAKLPIEDSNSLDDASGAVRFRKGGKIVSQYSLVRDIHENTNGNSCALAGRYLRGESVAMFAYKPRGMSGKGPDLFDYGSDRNENIQAFWYAWFHCNTS